jgi:hypothetical protein
VCASACVCVRGRVCRAPPFALRLHEFPGAASVCGCCVAALQAEEKQRLLVAEGALKAHTERIQRLTEENDEIRGIRVRPVCSAPPPPTHTHTFCRAPRKCPPPPCFPMPLGVLGGFCFAACVCRAGSMRGCSSAGPGGAARRCNDL